MIDSKGRLFGLINIIDLAILILLLVLVGAYFYRDRGATETSAPMATVKVLCPYLRPEVALQIHEGDQLLARGQLQPVFVKELRIEQARDSEPDAKGKIILQEHPFRKDVYLTLEGPVSINGAEIYLAGQQVRAGIDKYIMKTQYFEAEGEVLEVILQRE